MLEQLSQCPATGDRIEIRGFGSFPALPRTARAATQNRPIRQPDGKLFPLAGQGIARSGERRRGRRRLSVFGEGEGYAWGLSALLRY